MAKLTPETLSAICDRLVVHPYLKPAARAVGIDPSTVFAWLEKSRSDPPSLSFTWSEVDAPFHEHVAAAMRMSVMLIESRAREMALNGFDEVVTFQGRVQYELDPRYVGVDDATMVKLGLDKPSVDYHRYKRDAKGKAIPLKVKRKPSDALVTTVLRAHFRKLYGEHKSVSVGGGVLVVGTSHPLAAPKTIEHKPTDYVDMIPIEASEEEEARRGGYMAVSQRAKSSAELEERERRYLSRQHEIEIQFQEDDESEKEPSRAKPDPAPGDASGVASAATTPNKLESAIGGERKAAATASASKPVRETGIGYGAPPPGGYKVC